MAAAAHVDSEDEDSGEEFQSEDSEIDTDEELQLAFERKELKPGLNALVPIVERDQINDEAALKQRLEHLKLRLPWIERLDMVNQLAPLAPELMPHLSGNIDELAEDDFKREVLFYRQAQAAVLEAIPRLNSMGSRTKRPDDYFAQMAKSDEHMQKVRQSLLSQKMAIERREKAKKLREMKKYGKSVQQEITEKKLKDKRDFISSTKKLRRGNSDKLGMFDDRPGGKKEKQRPQSKNTREFKNKKFGFGGKKRGMKSNDAQSSADAFESMGNGKSKMRGKPMGGKQKSSRGGKRNGGRRK